MATLFAEFKEVGGYLSKHCGETWSWLFFLIFNEMFVLKKYIFKMGTLVEEPNPRAVLMFLVWMRFLSCTFPHPTGTLEHQPAVYFRVQAHRCPWHLSHFCVLLEEKGFDASFWNLFAFGFIPHTVGYVCSDSSAGGGWCGCVNCCSWAPSFCEEKHLSHVSLLWKKDNEHRLIWYFRINCCMIIRSNV